VTAALYLFDIDGTLLRAGGAGARALDAVFAARYDLERAMRGIDAGGRTDPWLVAQVFETRLGRTAAAAEIDAVLDAYLPQLQRELAASTNFRVLPHVAESLAWLAATPDVAIGLATGNIERGARIKLDHAGLTPRFAFGGYGCDHVERPRLVARAIERGRALAGPCAADRIVVVGDTPHDISAARACGVRAVAVATGSTSRPALDAAGADVVLDTLAELPAWHEEAIG
jgi:phosphoglycolate phosphatase-like HAD superfamily hydrolase